LMVGSRIALTSWSLLALPVMKLTRGIAILFSASVFLFESCLIRDSPGFSRCC
jgi:hypothetical protein